MTDTAPRTLTDVLNQGNPALVATGLSKIAVGDMLDAFTTPVDETLEAASGTVQLTQTPLVDSLLVGIGATMLEEQATETLTTLTPASLVGAAEPINMSALGAGVLTATATLAITVDGGAPDTAVVTADRAVAEAAGAGPYDLTLPGNETMDVTVDGGAPVTVAIAATAAYAETTAADPATWNVTPGGNLFVTMDGGAPVEVLFSSGPAAIQSVAEPFNLEPGQTVDVAINGLPPVTATFSAGVASIVGGAGPFALANGDDLDIAVNGGAPTNVTFLGTPAQIDGAVQTYNITDGWTLDIAVNGAAPITHTFATGNYVAIAAATAQEVADEFNGAGHVGVVAEVIAGPAIRFSTSTEGSGRTLQATAGNAATALGIDAALHTGTGFAANLSAATAGEVATRIAAVVATVTTDGVGNLTISTVQRGTGAALDVDAVTGGSASVALGLAGQSATGTGNVADIDAVTSAEAASVIDAALGATVSVVDAAGSVVVQTVGSGTGFTLNADTSTAIALGFTPGLQSGTGFAVNAAAATAAEVAAVLTAQLGVGAAVSVVGGRPHIESTIIGTGGSVAFPGGDTQSPTFAFVPVAGTGDCADLSAVTPSEFDAVAAAAGLAHGLTVPGGVPYLASQQLGTGASLAFAGGLATEMGFAGAVGAGDVADLSAVTVAELKVVIDAAVAGVVVDDGETDLTLRTVAEGAAASLELGAGTDTEFGFTPLDSAVGIDAGLITVTAGRFYCAPDDPSVVYLPDGTADATEVTVRYVGLPFTVAALAADFAEL